MRTPAAAALLVLVAFAKVHAETSDTAHKEHDEHEGIFASGAVYDVGEGINYLVAVPVEGGFEDETLAFMIVSAASADSEGLEGAEEDAAAAWDAYISGAEEPTVLAPGDSATPSADLVYQISLEAPLVLVPVDVADARAYAVFLEHGPDEVVTALVSPSGVTLVAAAEEVAEEEDEEEEFATGAKWANTLIASLLVSACSFAGLFVVVNKRVANSIGLSHAFVFASGALLTASFLHLIPEALEGLESKYDSSHTRALCAGLSVMGGISIGIVIHALLGSDHSHSPSRPHLHETGVIAADGGGCCGASVAGEVDLMPLSMYERGKANGQAPVSSSHAVVQNTEDVTRPPTPSKADAHNLQALIAARKGRPLLDVKGLQPVCWNVIIGDLVHNFADGVAIGAAFLTCSKTIGWTVTASAVLHEIPHEIADFMALLNGGMSLKQAFAYNFLSALSALLGTVVILSLESTLSDADIAIVLLVGAGSFIFIALTELVPEALSVISNKGGDTVMCSQVGKLGSFLLGALLIGISLIFDEHCDAGGDGHDH